MSVRTVDEVGIGPSATDGGVSWGDSARGRESSAVPTLYVTECARVSKVAKHGRSYEEGSHLHRSSISSVAELGLRRSGNTLTIDDDAAHDANHFISGDFANIRVDWHGSYAAVCCHRPSFRWDNFGYEQFGDVEFVGSKRRRG